MKIRKEDRKAIIIIGLTVIFFVTIITAGDTIKEVITLQVEGNWDIEESVKQHEYDQFLVEESDFDYSDPGIQEVAENIKMSTTSANDALTETIRFVARNTKYDSQVTINSCYQEKASDVLKSQRGDCVSMSRLVTALLRAQGIPARTAGGCLSASRRCTPIFSAIPGEQAKSVVMTEGDFKKRGFLHEWVEAWTPEGGWVLIEATSGQKFPLECVSYLQYSYDSNNIDRCVINNQNFWNECRGY